jgi:hypothetical protein
LYNLNDLSTFSDGLHGPDARPQWFPSWDGSQLPTSRSDGEIRNEESRTGEYKGLPETQVHSITHDRFMVHIVGLIGVEFHVFVIIDQTEIEFKQANRYTCLGVSSAFVTSSLYLTNLEKSHKAQPSWAH